MCAWRTGAEPAATPISRRIAALSAFAAVLSGGKSTTRRIEPFGGGGTPISRAARSALPEMSAGVSSVTHSSVDTMPVWRSFRFGASPSISTMALPDASWPVTTRRTGRRHGLTAGVSTVMPRARHIRNSSRSTYSSAP